MQTHSCPHCGLVLDRDHTATLRIQEVGMAQSATQGIWYPVRQRVRWPDRAVERWRGSERWRGNGTVGHTDT